MLSCSLAYQNRTSSPFSSRFLDKLNSSYQLLISQVSDKGAINKFKFKQFQGIASSLCQAIFSVIHTSLQIVQKVNNYSLLGLDLDLPVENKTSWNQLALIDECNSQQDQEPIQTPKSQNQPLICEGLMYRLIDEGKALKPYYYKLINTELFAFRSQDDTAFKRAVYYGHDSYLVVGKTYLKTSKSECKVYCLEAGSADKITQYFLTSEDQVQKWKTSLLKAMGLPGLFSQDFKILAKVGRGRFGTVSKAQNLRSGATVAIKAIDKLDLSTVNTKLMRQEKEVHKICKHPNLIHLYNIYEDKQNVYLEMQYLSGGSLFQYITRADTVPHQVIQGVLHQVSNALVSLKKLGIMHRDIKCENILLIGELVKDSDYSVPEVKLGDYGLSTFISSNEKPSLTCGTLSYMAPQVFLSGTYDYAADVFSLGVVAYYMCNRSYPILAPDLDSFKQKLIRQDPDFTAEEFVKLPKRLRTLIQKMLSKKPHKRPSLQEIIKITGITASKPKSP